jgi:hypothetical protein
LIANVVLPGYAAGMDEAFNVPMLVKGQMVEVTHLQGTEIGEVLTLSIIRPGRFLCISIMRLVHISPHLT